MNVCKFFLEGNCKFGPRCKFEHVNAYNRRYDTHGSTDYSSGDRPIGLSILKSDSTTFGNKEYEQSYNQSNQQNSFSQAAQVPSYGSKHNIHDVMQIILKDILQSEKGNQWQLSAFCPQKDLTNVPGLEDHSPEELRWECYKALQNGTLSLCQAAVQQLYAQVEKVNNDLKKKDTAYIIIERWLREGQGSQNATQTSITSSSGPTFAPQLSTADAQTVNNSSFSFVLPQQQSSEQTYPHVTSVFGGNSSQQMFSPGRAPVDSSAYSSVEELTEGELQAFKSDRFVFGAIPTKPPPKELC